MITDQKSKPEELAVPVLDPVPAYALWAAEYPPFAHNPLMQAEERALLGLLPPDLRGLALLDAGCGSGRYLRHVLRRGARRAVGVDLSAEMLARARAELGMGQASNHSSFVIRYSSFVRASLDALPIRDAWADITICGLTLGHLADLRPPLAELARATRPGGRLLCSDFHPVGRDMGWRREFSAGGQRYAVRHTWHQAEDWRRAAGAVGLEIVRVLEPRLELADIPAGARFDAAALELPVALVFELRRGDDRPTR